MAVQFVTIDQYLAFQGLPAREPRPQDPDEGAAYDAETARLTALLQRASDRIRLLVRLARVRYLTTGLPRDAAVAEAFARATAAQAEWFEEQGGATGGGGLYNSISLIGVSFSKTGGLGAAQTAGESRDAPEAREILAAAGIFRSAVRH